MILTIDTSAVIALIGLLITFIVVFFCVLIIGHRRYQDKMFLLSIFISLILFLLCSPFYISFYNYHYTRFWEFYFGFFLMSFIFGFIAGILNKNWKRGIVGGMMGNLLFWVIFFVYSLIPWDSFIHMPFVIQSLPNILVGTISGAIGGGIRGIREVTGTEELKKKNKELEKVNKELDK
jgi:hypothetical protein